MEVTNRDTYIKMYYVERNAPNANEQLSSSFLVLPQLSVINKVHTQGYKWSLQDI